MKRLFNFLDRSNHSSENSRNWPQETVFILVYVRYISLYLSVRLRRSSPTKILETWRGRTQISRGRKLALKKRGDVYF